MFRRKLIQRYYAGIGSRETPREILTLMESYAADLSNRGFTLRSGGATGADSAFEFGCDSVKGNKEIFYARDAGQPHSNWAWDEVLNYIPTDRTSAPFDKWKLFVRQLLVRNMFQVLGRNGRTPVKFVLCWAPSNNYADSSAGGTGWAVRCALAKGIPVYNLYVNDERERFESEWLG